MTTIKEKTRVFSPQQIGAAYDQIADHWLDENFNSENGLALHEKALTFIGAAGGESLNVGCGCNTRFNHTLRNKGLSIEGIDISSEMLRLARERDPGATYLEADICSWQPSKAYTFITAWDSIWHLPLSHQRPVMVKLIHALAPGGVFIFTAGGLPAESEHTNATMGPEMYYSTLGMPALLELVMACNTLCRHLEFDQWPEPHLCMIVQRSSRQSQQETRQL